MDEANAAIGMLRLATREVRDWMDAGAHPERSVRCRRRSICAGRGRRPAAPTEVPVVRLEAEIEAMNAALPTLTSFMLPGGTAGAARAHLARTVARRAEREVVRLAADETVDAGGDALSQSAVRPPVRAGSRAEWQRCERCAGLPAVSLTRWALSEMWLACGIACGMSWADGGDSAKSAPRPINCPGTENFSA